MNHIIQLQLIATISVFQEFIRAGWNSTEFHRIGVSFSKFTECISSLLDTALCALTTLHRRSKFTECISSLWDTAPDGRLDNPASAFPSVRAFPPVTAIHNFLLKD